MVRPRRARAHRLVRDAVRLVVDVRGAAGHRRGGPAAAARGGGGGGGGVRPDIGAAALALGGLYLVVVALDERGVARLALASFVFALAWSFKQSCVWTFAGSLLALTLEERSAKRSLALLAPFAVFAAASLYLGGAVYRENVLFAPALGPWRWSLLAGVVERAFPQNPFIFGFWLLVFGWECRAGVGKAWRRLAPAERLLVIVAVTASAFGSFALGREGSNKNHLLEGYVACALASWCALGRLPITAPGWIGGAGALATLPLVALPLLQFIMAAGVVPEQRFGRVVLCTDRDVRAFAELEKIVHALPHPLFADDEVFSQPWHSTDDRYPALVFDGTWYDIARRQGLLPADFPVGELRARGYRAAVFPLPNRNVDVLTARGVRCEPLGPHPFGFDFVACRL